MKDQKEISNKESLNSITKTVEALKSLRTENTPTIPN
jgi:hypothetical protein